MTLPSDLPPRPPPPPPPLALALAPARSARFCTGSILRHTVVMAGTGSLGMIAVFVVDLLNLLYISLLHNRTLTAAVAFTGAVGFLQISVSIGMSIGLGAVVSRRIGAGRMQEASHIGSAALVVMAGVMFAIGIGTILLLDPILRGLGAHGAALHAAHRNTAIVAPFLPLIGIGMGCSALLRSVGDARRSMTITLWAAALLAALDPLLIFALHLGLLGAAVGTVLSRATVCALGLIAVRRHDLLRMPIWGTLLADMRPVAVVAAPAILTNLATPVASAFTTHAMAHFGQEAVSGQVAIDRITPVAFAFVYALTASVGPIMAQNLGAGQIARVRQTLLCSLTLVLSCVIVMWAVLASLQNQLVWLFSATGNAAALLHLFCSWTVPGLLFVGALFVANTAFNSLGAPLLSTCFNWGRATLGTIPFVWIGMRHGPAGILIGQALGGVVFGIAAAASAFTLIGRLRPNPATNRPEITLPAASAKATMVGVADLTRGEVRSG